MPAKKRNSKGNSKKSSSKSGGMCQPAKSYLTIMVLLYITTYIITVVNGTEVSHELRERMFSPQGIFVYFFKLMIWVIILNIMCSFNCVCLANIFVFFGALLYLSVLIYLVSVLLGFNVDKIGDMQQMQKKESRKGEYDSKSEEHDDWKHSEPEGFTI